MRTFLIGELAQKSGKSVEDIRRALASGELSGWAVTDTLLRLDRNQAARWIARTQPGK